jgi:hypothetical protein
LSHFANPYSLLLLIHVSKVGFFIDSIYLGFPFVSKLEICL